MAFDLYKYAMAAITAALILLWSVQPLWGATEFFALSLLVFPIYTPLLYRLATKLWVARKRRLLDLPKASDRDIIDFVGEELDRAAIAWQWRLALRGTSRWDELEVGEDDEPLIYVRVRNGVLEVSSDEDGASRFVDPVAAVDHILARYGGVVKSDEGMFVALEEESG